MPYDENPAVPCSNCSHSIEDHRDWGCCVCGSAGCDKTVETIALEFADEKAKPSPSEISCFKVMEENATTLLKIIQALREKSNPTPPKPETRTHRWD